MRRPLTRALLGAVAAGGLLACAERQSRFPLANAEFLLSAGDSTFWVDGAAAGLRMRGAPIVVASWGGQFYEIYVTDDDRSFEDAVFVGQRIFRRDLVSGDSIQVFVDTSAQRAAFRYAEANPSARPLEPDEEGSENPPTSVVAEVDVLDLYGPFLSYEYHLDVNTPEADEWHSTRRGVLDLRTGKPASLVDLFGANEAARLSSAGRIAYRATVDSVRVATDERGRRAALSLASFQFDPNSFSLADANGQPVVEFVAPGRGAGPSGFTLPIPALPATAPAWWSDVRPTLPASVDNEGTVTWRHGAVSVTARFDSTGESARISLADSAGHRWEGGGVGGPVRSVFWLDAAAVDSTDRHALARAFDEAAQYDARMRSAANTFTPQLPLQFAARRLTQTR